MSSSAPNFEPSKRGAISTRSPLLSSVGLPAINTPHTNWRDLYSTGERALAYGDYAASRASFAAALEAAEASFPPADFARIVTTRKLSSVYTRLGDPLRADAIITEASGALNSSVVLSHPAYLLLDVARADNARLRGDFESFRAVANYLYQSVTEEVTRGALVEAPCLTEFFLPAAQCVFQRRLESRSVEGAEKLVKTLRRLGETVVPSEQPFSGVVDLMEAKLNVAAHLVAPTTMTLIQRSVDSLHSAPGKYSLEIYEAHVCGLLASLELNDLSGARNHLRVAKSILASGQLDAITPLHRTFLLRAEEAFARATGRPQYSAHILREHVDLLRRHAPEAVYERREILANLEGVHRGLGNQRELDRTQRDLLTLIHSALGEGSQAFAEALWSRAISRLSAGAADDAKNLLVWASEIADGMSDVSPQLAVGIGISLAKATSMLGRPSEALSLLQKTEQVADFDIESNRYLHSMRELVRARALIKLGAFQDALARVEELVGDLPPVPDDFNGREAVRVLAGLRILDGRSDEAERILLPFRGKSSFNEPMTRLLLSMALLTQEDPQKVEDGETLARIWLDTSDEEIAADLRSLGKEVAWSVLPLFL